MNTQQLDIFGQIDIANPLKGKRICLTGEFRMPQKELYAKLKAIGVDTIDRVSETRIYKEGDAIPPVKESTSFFIVGSNPNEDSLKRYALNEHDGYHAKMISEDKLYDYLRGHFTEKDIVPEIVEKHLQIDISYYNWTAPSINGKAFVSRVSSPLKYDKEGKDNPISQKEIYVPDIEGVNMGAFYQIIGNLGGYANKEYFDDTNMILLSNKTLKKLEQGIKDDVIIDIEKRYNKSNTKIFNIQFTSESDFINWVEKRMTIFPDKSTIRLLNLYKSNLSS
ncbi:MAG: hypothetical protein J6Y04_07540 [Bacteroidaceae bacterium]|nr:hypothetical protein [Bacteroidaceae bacterium]